MLGWTNNCIDISCLFNEIQKVLFSLFKKTNNEFIFLVFLMKIKKSGLPIFFIYGKKTNNKISVFLSQQILNILLIPSLMKI